MEVGCPTCTRQLNVAQAAPGATLQCPYCGGMFQLAAPQAQAAVAGAYVPAGAYPPPVPPPPSFEDPGAFISTRRPIRRQRKSDSGMKIALAVIAVAIVGGLIGGGVWMSRKNSPPAVIASPTDVARQKAQELVSQEMKLPAGARFALQEGRVEKLPKDRWKVTSHVDVPSRVGGVVRRQRWIAHIYKADGVWKLDDLEVDGEMIAGTSEKPQRKSSFSETPRWFGPDNNAARSQPAGPDRSTKWAVDRVAEDIKEAARLRKTLVVWLIDRSASARPQQQSFLQNVEGILKELAPAKPGQDADLQMAVVSFGSEVEFPLEEPSTDADAVRTALQSIGEDPSGREMTFTAISEAVQKFGSFSTEQQGYVIFVVVSDETGDDESQLDQTALLVKEHQIVVHTVGVSAPFGLAVAEAQKGLEGGDGASRVRQGPESRYSEMISLASLGGVAVELDSGFGPFALSRLCQDSGGQYRACKDHGVAAGSQFLSTSWGSGDTGNPVFEANVLRKYAPDYVSEAEYQQILASNKACQALHEAAKLPFAQVLQSANTSFPKRDEASFKRSLDAAQRDAAKFEPRLITLHDTLKKGESDRPKLTRPRWQAAYDLALGRAAAARVKTEGYNQMLAKIKAAGNFTKPGADTWVLNESDTIGAGSTFEKMLAQSRECLQRVVKDHPGTPWAYLAERELQINAGWQWTEQ